MFALTLFPVFYKIEAQDLKLPQCQDEEIVNTVVDFFISESVWSAYGESKIKEMINSSIHTANLTLKNSCVPMRRQSGKLYQVDMTIQAFDPDLASYRNQLLRVTEPTIIKEITQKPNHYYALVVDDLPDDILGKTDVYLDPQFLILSDQAEKYTLEHELGHLANAWHDDTSWNSSLSKYLEEYTPDAHKNELHAYARGYNCAGRRTIMSQSSVYYLQLPIYSSPDIFFGDEACGDHEHADNARQLREYARRLKDKMKNNV